MWKENFRKKSDYYSKNAKIANENILQNKRTLN
jgi:hypothetical protein